MNFFLFARASCCALLAATLAACSTMQPAEVDESSRIRLHQEKSGQLSAYRDWNMAGRLAVSSSEDGGSGNFRWKQNAQGNQMDFHGALGRGAWRLVADAAGAELELADGTVRREDSIDQLVRLQLGWDIPVESLSWWVRGLAAPGEYQQRRIDENGNLSELLQDGWAIDFEKYRDFQGISLPVKLTARQSDWKVKLAVREWELQEDAAAHD